MNFRNLQGILRNAVFTDCKNFLGEFLKAENLKKYNLRNNFNLLLVKFSICRQNYTFSQSEKFVDTKKRYKSNNESLILFLFFDFINVFHDEY